MSEPNKTPASDTKKKFDPDFPWVSSKTGLGVKIIEQGNETTFVAPNGDKKTVPTHEFTSEYATSN